MSAHNLENKVAIITGANIGLGYETAYALAKKSCNVVLACRNLDKAEKSKQKIIKDFPYAKIDCLEIDTSSLKSVRRFAETFKNKYSMLHYLVNNAGIMFAPYNLTEDGFESHFAVNYLGHFLLTGLLLDILEHSDNARVVTLASVAHRWGKIYFDDIHLEKTFTKKKAYGQSKLACLVFAYELQRRLEAKSYNTISLAVHPGISNTNLVKHFPKWVQKIVPYITQSAKAGALPTLEALLSSKMKGMEYLGPSGFREYWGKPKLVDSSSYSKDIDIAKKIWVCSENLTNFKYLS